ERPPRRPPPPGTAPRRRLARRLCGGPPRRSRQDPPAPAQTPPRRGPHAPGSPRPDARRLARRGRRADDAARMEWRRETTAAADRSRAAGAMSEGMTGAASAVRGGLLSYAVLAVFGGALAAQDPEPPSPRPAAP